MTASFTPNVNVDALANGTMLDGYVITGLIGQGGFGVVYVGRDEKNNRTVAIKEFLPAAIAGRAPNGSIAPRSADLAKTFATGLKGFMREANLLSEFAHPALVAVHRAWEQNSTAYMAMQYYPGKTLRDVRVRHNAPMSQDQVRAYMAPVFEAVSELHAHRVIHRDISPDNILVMPTGETVLLDLGAARQVLGGMTQALTTILKPGFAPIEQYVEDGSMEQGRWTDVYGLGAVIYFLVTGKPPTPATTRIVRDSLPSLADVAGPGYSPAFTAAVTRALSIRAIDRFKSMSEFRSTLGWNMPLRPVVSPPSTAADSAQAAPTLTPEQIQALRDQVAVAPPVAASAVAASAPVSPPDRRTAASHPVASPSSPITNGGKTPIARMRGGAGDYEDKSKSKALVPIVVVSVALIVVAVVLFLR